MLVWLLAEFSEPRLPVTGMELLNLLLPTEYRWASTSDAAAELNYNELGSRSLSFFLEKLPDSNVTILVKFHYIFLT